MNKEIKLVDIRAQYDEIREELHQVWDHIFSTMHLMLGPNMKSFEEEFAQYSGARYGVGVDSGTAALHLGLKAIGVKPGEEVFTVSYTFFATVEAIIHAGATPVMLDVDESSGTMSPEKLDAFISENCRFDGECLTNSVTGKHITAIVPVHLYGMPADMDPIMAIARKYKLKVLEDCAQAHGAEYRGKRIGSFGDAAGYSFYFSKNLSALGEGGIVLTSSEGTRDALNRLRLHGQTDKYTHAEIGYNSRLDEMQAAVLRLKLKHLDRWNQRRVAIADQYTRGLSDLPLSGFHASNGEVRPVYHLYVIRTPKRDQLADFLRKQNIGVGIHYPVPSHLQPGVEYLGYKPGDLPISETLSSEVLSLPMHPHLTDEEVNVVIAAVREFFRK